MKQSEKRKYLENGVACWSNQIRTIAPLFALLKQFVCIGGSKNNLLEKEPRKILLFTSGDVCNFDETHFKSQINSEFLFEKIKKTEKIELHNFKKKKS